MEILQEHINLFLKNCKAANCAGVFYSLPFQNEFEFLLQDLNDIKKGSYHPFVFFPFDAIATKPVYLHPEFKNEEAIEFIKYVNNSNSYWINPSLQYIDTTTWEQYNEGFKKYQESIQSEECMKAILSTVIKQELPRNFNAGEYILKLRKLYPQAFVYLFSSPDAGTWIGATPETLLKWENRLVSTMSLAGTKKTQNPDQFGIKEKKEQEIVTEYIRSIFEKRFSNVHVDHTSKLTYGEMEHLITLVEVSVNNEFNKNDFLSLAKDLHPTPAVGGYPKLPAVDLIKKTETHPRLYYSGYLGYINEQSAHLAVNLRCMNIDNDHVYVFAGGGITADSKVDAEWEETRLKAQALLKFL